ncbi:hypothetical protein PPYR_05806 [Photinus pyralis]|uniref:Uncharacterized protein n=1 Tax=Photinus pyralis TaxID=7054 RepID=A0A5N4AVQ6_PHOPY|nr:protein KRTCAP2 homolog [Photinus pyralis]KAB0801452.1 hypothetical protein PPYR_05806 [Photinus pyralis]
MAVSSGISLLLASISALFLFSGVQMYLPWFVGTHLRTIFGGYLGSLLFIFILTAVGNLESFLFGKSFQMKVFPEVTFCLLVAVFASALVHRVCATTCFLFSIIQLYYINKYSQKVHAVPVPVQNVPAGRKKK